MKLSRTMRTALAASAALILTAALAGAVWASVPDASGLIHGCYAVKGGTLRVIDTDAGQTCGRGEAPLTWSQTGPAGPPGAAGPAGANGVSGYEVISQTLDYPGALGTSYNPSYGSEFFAVITCPDGKRALSGGGAINGWEGFYPDSPTAALIDSRPTADGTAWRLAWAGDRTSNPPLHARVSVVCATIAG